MKRLLLVLGLVAGMLLVAPSAALACSCAAASTATHVKQADSVFEGNLAWSSSTAVDATYGVDVTGVFKGRAATFEKLRSVTTSRTCGRGPLATERKYVFFVQGENPGQMQVDGCGGTALSDPTLLAEVEAASGPASDPIPAKQATAEADGLGLGWLGWIIVVGGVAVVVALAVTTLRSKDLERR